MANPGRVRALTIYEPTLFAVVDAQCPPPNGADGIRNAVLAAGEALLGEASPESAHAVASALLPVLPRVQIVEFAAMGHMAPVTHPEAINIAIAKFLSET